MGNNILDTRRDFYLNADFDSTLRGGTSALDGKDHGFVHEMSRHYLFAADPAQKGDAVILHAPLPRDFRDYMAAMGLGLPETLLHPDFRADAEFTPFGWNAHAERLNARYAEPALHPGIGIVRKANSRAFGLALEGGAGSPWGAVPAGLFATLGDLEAHMRDHPSPTGWMAKGNHGHAGTANRRLFPVRPADPSRQDVLAVLAAEDRHALECLFGENGAVVLEPWHDRILDMAVNFRVDREGRVHDWVGHELATSRDGSFLGVEVAPSRLPPEPWTEELHSSSRELARALHGIGYFGPVGVDAYAWDDGGTPRLRPWVDINARLSMALPAHGLARRLPGRHVFWFWAKPRKLSLPATFEQLVERLGVHAFRPGRGTGILAVSPLRLEPPSPSLAPKRVSFALCAEDEAELETLRAAFEDALGRKG